MLAYMVRNVKYSFICPLSLDSQIQIDTLNTKRKKERND